MDELIASKTKQERGDKHLADLESRLGRFANMASEHQPSDRRDDSKHLDELNVAGRTQQNHLRHITSLFRFAARKKYLPKDALDEIAAVEKPEAELTDIEIFSPVELRELLTAARPEIIPWLAVAAFAGLRTAELQRLDWHEVNLAERYIEVTAAKSKTASRRLVPITDNLLAWLTPRAQIGGRVTGFENMAKQIGWLVQDVNESREKHAKENGHDLKNAQKFSGSGMDCVTALFRIGWQKRSRMPPRSRWRRAIRHR